VLILCPAEFLIPPQLCKSVAVLVRKAAYHDFSISKRADLFNVPSGCPAHFGLARGRDVDADAAVDAPEGQKTDGIDETSDRRHSEEDIGSDFLRRWITACRGATRHTCRRILSGVDLVFISGSAPQRGLPLP
jgi:hypothetical protein